ncbi:MAG: arginine--tRNA ligase [Deltaproteobacteria bacterium]|nr:arginine--tRNA ligase [Deltaproteobacteria bacterium]
MSATDSLVPVQEALATKLQAAVADLVEVPPTPPVDRSKAGFASDFQTPLALQLKKQLGGNPRQIASTIVDKLGGDDMIAGLDIGGPGFIGVTLSDAYLQTHLAGMLASDRLGVPVLDDSTVVIDFSAPNVAKRMHIGHIRSTIIGDALRRLGTFLGQTIIADNHIGDWGTQFGRVIWAWKNWRDEEAFAADPIGELERLYVTFVRKEKEDASYTDRAKAELVKLQSGDAENNALWQMMIDTSRVAFESIYERLDIHFDVTHGESFYNDMLQPLVDELLADGTAQISEGAAVIFFKDEHGDDTLPPFLIRKSDGAALYATSDLATVRYRETEWSPTRCIYVTDTRQQNHFRQVFEVARRMGVDTRLDHVWFGMMTLPEGAFSTRDGNAPPLHEFLDEAEKRARDQQVKRLESLGETWPEEELDQLARIIGLGGVKYSDLSNNPQTNITFSFDKMLSLEGNTAVYLQYTSARTHSLSKKAASEGIAPPDGTTLKLALPQERDLMLQMLDFGKATRAAWEQGKPNLLATYLYELASKYHTFYQSCPVKTEADATLQMSRLNLNLLARKVLAQGLDLLGIDAPERM